MLMLANQLIMTLSMAHFQKHLSVLYIYVVSDVLCNTSGSLAAGEQSGDPDSQSCTIYPDIIKITILLSAISKCQQLQFFDKDQT